MTLQEQYKQETGKESMKTVTVSAVKFYIYAEPYIQWLEEKVTLPTTPNLIVEKLEQQKRYYQDLLDLNYDVKDFGACLVCQTKINVINDIKQLLTNKNG